MELRVLYTFGHRLRLKNRPIVSLHTPRVGGDSLLVFDRPHGLWSLGDCFLLLVNDIVLAAFGQLCVHLASVHMRRLNEKKNNVRYFLILYCTGNAK